MPKTYTDLIMEEYATITNREAIRDKIHALHNYMRNHGVGYGLNALKVFNLIYGLKQLEVHDLLDKCGLSDPEACRFSSLLAMANSGDEAGVGNQLIETILDQIHGSKLRPFLFYEIPRAIKPETFVYIVREIEHIGIIEKTANVQLSGKIYEYFVGRDDSAISELGAYFTDRHIVQLIYDMVKPAPAEDGSIPAMIDMFGGSGGFTVGYIRYLQEHYPEIDWTTQIHNVYHYDANADVLRAAGLEFFGLSKTIPYMDTKGTSEIPRIAYKNSFSDEFKDGDGKLMYFPLIVTNPPYGGDKNKKTSGEIKREKIIGELKTRLKAKHSTKQEKKKHKQYETQLKELTLEQKQIRERQLMNHVKMHTCSERIQAYAKRHGMPITDKEGASLVQMMEMLAEGGTACGVLKEGVFFNSSYKKHRKHLVENFVVTDVVSVPADQFENTSTKTSIVLFKKQEGKRTEKVVFSVLTIKKYEDDLYVDDMEGYLRMVHSQGDIETVERSVVAVASGSQILANSNVSLDSKQYLGAEHEVKAKEGYRMVELGDVSDIIIGRTPSTKNPEFWKDGKHKWLSVKDITKQDRIYDTEKKITDKAIQKMYQAPTNSVMMSFKLTIGTIGILQEPMYFNEAIVCLNSKIENIPQYYLYYILKCIDVAKMARGSIGKGNLNKELLKQLKIPIPTDPDTLESWTMRIEKLMTSKQKTTDKIKSIEAKIQQRVKDIQDNEECNMVELGSVCEFKNGTRITKKRNTEGDIPVYGGGDITFYTNTTNREENTLIMSRFGISKNCVRYIQNPFFLNDSGMSIHTTKKELQSYINSYLMSSHTQSTIYKQCTSGSCQKNINQQLLKQLKIPIPTDPEVINSLNPLFRKLEKYQARLEKVNKDETQLMEDLKQETIE